MPRRSRARAIVLQALFRADFDPQQDLAVDDAFLNRRLLRNAALVEFAVALLHGVVEKRAEIDAEISAKAANWSLSRMAATDRNVLRMGAYELMFTDTPRAVVINESIELARRFGTANSAQFVNGILDQM